MGNGAEVRASRPHDSGEPPQGEDAGATEAKEARR